MKKFLIVSSVAVLLFFTGRYLYGEYKEFQKTAAILEKLKGGKIPEVTMTPLNLLRDGDIVFQQSLSGQSRAIQLATHSLYSHCGILYKIENNYYVFEAVEPVKLTPLAEWMGRGKGGSFRAKRLKNADQILNDAVMVKMKKAGEAFKGKHYDPYFEWNGNSLYCSELVWKIYKEATGLEIGQLQTLSSFDLSDPLVKKKLKERYGNHIPMDEKVISPANMFNSDLLVTVKGY